MNKVPVLSSDIDISVILVKLFHMLFMDTDGDCLLLCAILTSRAVFVVLSGSVDIPL